MRESHWRGALAYLHEAGWSIEDIDETCDALEEARNWANFDLDELDDDEVRSILESNLSSEEITALVAVVEIRSRTDSETEIFAEALNDLDNFAATYVDGE